MHDLTSTRDVVGMYQAAHHVDLTMLLGHYQRLTPGTWLVSRVTIELPTGSRIQPHLSMFIGYGPLVHFQLSAPDGRVSGAPQLAVDVEYAIDETEEQRRADACAAGGVDEYMLWEIKRWTIHWYRLTQGAYRRVEPDESGLIKSSALPGLWVSVWALLGGEGRDRDWRPPIDRGVLEPEHAELRKGMKGSK